MNRTAARQKDIWFCVHCRLPFSVDHIYKVGRSYTCAACWADVATAFMEAFPDWDFQAQSVELEGRRLRANADDATL